LPKFAQNPHNDPYRENRESIDIIDPKYYFICVVYIIDRPKTRGCEKYREE
jgi:hypothetical protein